MSEEILKVGVVQMQSSEDPWLNLLQIQNYLSIAHENSCDFLLFPENVLYRGPKRHKNFSREDFFLKLNDRGRLVLNSDFSKALNELITTAAVPFVLGSVMEQKAEAQLPYNSSWFCGVGSEILSYSKTHLFDYTNGELQYKESSDFSRGVQLLSVGYRNWQIGFSICYDLRFPELYRSLVLKEHCELLLVPAAFDQGTGRAHWESLLRARAIENQSYVLAAAQWGPQVLSGSKKRHCHGGSMIVNPWGEIISKSLEQGDDFLIAKLSKRFLTEVRSKLPALKNTSF